MSTESQQRKLVLDTYNKIINEQVDNPSQVLHSAIDYLRDQGSNIAELSLLYCVEADYLFDTGNFDEAYRWAMNAVTLDSERKEVLDTLVKLYAPAANDDEQNKSVGEGQNQYEDFEKAREVAIKLETLYASDPDALCTAGQCYSSLGAYEDALRVLKAAFKLSKTQRHSKEQEQEIKSRLTQCLVDRYSFCPNTEHQRIITYLVELIEWKHNELCAANLAKCVEEIWERAEYILDKHAGEWHHIDALLNSIPCSVPLSAKLLNLVLDAFLLHGKLRAGVSYLTRIISEYQTYTDSMMSTYAKFVHYDVCYLNRAKFYRLLGAQCRGQCLDDIERANARRPTQELITEGNVEQYLIEDDDEVPMVETVQQIKKRRGSMTYDVRNVSISPMPKEYRDFHLTPKSRKYAAKGKGQRRRHLSMSAVECKQVEEDHYAPIPRRSVNVKSGVGSQGGYERLEAIQSKNRSLETQVADLKNELHAQTSKTVQNKKQIEELQELIESLNQQIASRETVERHGEQNVVRVEARSDAEIERLRVQNESYLKMMSKLEREVKILKDCKKKNALRKAAKEQGQVHGANQNAGKTGCCRSVYGLIRLLVILLVIAGTVWHFSGWLMSTDSMDGVETWIGNQIERIVEAARTFKLQIESRSFVEDMSISKPGL